MDDFDETLAVNLPSGRINAAQFGNGWQPVAAGADLLLPNSQHHLRKLDELSALYQEIPEALARTLTIADSRYSALARLRD